MWKTYISVLIILMSVQGLKAQQQALTQLNLSHDSVSVPISQQYEGVFFIKRSLMGDNYRDAWKKPIRLPVFQLTGSPFRIFKRGGGAQTKSLRLIDKGGKIWALRSVDKDVRAGIPKMWHATPVLGFKQDLISADHPYGASVAAVLLNAAGIPTPDPVYFYVNDDTAFGEYRTAFAGTVCMLEEYAPTPDGSSSFSTDSIMKLMANSNAYTIIQESYLRTRLIDMLLGDWDRHQEQWNWGIRDSAGMKLIYPIPRDRDHALYYSTGLAPALITKFSLPFMVGFNSKGDKLTALNQKSWVLDRKFLNGLDAAQWRSIIGSLQQELNDGVIDAAIQRIPPELEKDRTVIRAKLRSRRDALSTEAMNYYNFLTKEVEINGSNESEELVLQMKDTGLEVSMWTLDGGMRGKQIFHRTINPAETKTLLISTKKGSDMLTTPERLPVRVMIIQE